MDSENDGSRQGQQFDKAGAWHRLRNEGRLEGFNARREQLRATLREQGMRRKEAADEAWWRALAEFPPLESERQECDESRDVGNEGLEEALAQFNASENDVVLEDDVEWVYVHLGAGNLTPADAPSPGAWNLLTVARQDRRWFLKDILPEIRRKSADENEKSVRQAELKSIEERRQILEGILRRSSDETLELIRNRLGG